jgi:hypothetical protein
MYVWPCPTLTRYEELRFPCYQRHHKEDIVVGSFIGFSCAWLTYHVYFTSPFLRISRQMSSPAREVYGDNNNNNNSRDSMELLQIPEEEEPLRGGGQDV